MKSGLAPQQRLPVLSHDATGQPVVKKVISCGIPKLLEVTSLGGDWCCSDVRTDKNRHSELKGLLIGHTYRLRISDVGIYKYEVKNANPIDLDSIRLKRQ